MMLSRPTAMNISITVTGATSVAHRLRQVAKLPPVPIIVASLDAERSGPEGLACAVEMSAVTDWLRWISRFRWGPAKQVTRERCRRSSGPRAAPPVHLHRRGSVSPWGGSGADLAKPDTGSSRR